MDIASAEKENSFYLRYSDACDLSFEFGEKIWSL